MQKTKLGISVTLAMAALYFLGLYGGYVILGVFVGYILLKEEDAGLKKEAVRVLLLMLLFSLVGTAVNLVPNILSIFTNLLEIIDVHVYFTFFRRVFDVLALVLSLLKTVVFVLLGLAAVFGKSTKLPVIDPIIEKYMN